jgi:hypothetical protein
LFLVFLFFSKNGYENEFSLPERLLAKASFSVSGGFSVRVQKSIGAFRVISRGRNSRFAGGSVSSGVLKTLFDD